MATPAIAVKNLSKNYGDVLAVDNVTFEVPMGTICGFVGPNGAGKTTTIRMLLGLITPTAGHGEITGISIAHPEKYLQNVGALIEGPAFYPALSGLENLKVLAELGGYPKSRCEELLDLVDLKDRAQSKYKTYSLGMKQRLGIAAALLPQPKLLILDEPTNGLDPSGMQEVRDLIAKLATEGVTVFVSSHLLSEIEVISKHLVMLRKGEIVFAGEMKDLLQRRRPTINAKPTKAEDLNRLMELAISTGHNADIADGSILIDADQDWAATFNKLAFDNGIVLTELTPIRATLEETFFEMTGENK